MKPLCDDCEAPPEAGESRSTAQVYTRCSGCGIIRACFGDNPEPQAARLRRVPEAVQDWQRGRNY